jgi:septal ring factor EnvC (AmiA/AmiB activator)
MTWLLFVALFAGRPPEALKAEHEAAEAEVKDLERRSRALGEQAEERRGRLKRRMRALYKLSSGGYLRLLSGAETAIELSARHAAVGRVLERDLTELAAVREEGRAVDADHARRSDQLARTLALGELASQAGRDEPTGLATRRGKLPRPVRGDVKGRFGVYQDPELKLQASRRGIELSSLPGEATRAIAPGMVKLVGDLPGIGRGIAVDHGDGYLTVTGRLRAVYLGVGEPVVAGAVLGEAQGPTVYLEIAQGGTPFDPLPWLVR